MKHQVRIIGGLYRGKKLPVPAVQGLRPTTDRVRETVFNWLMHDIRDARCLDAFAGTGALGFEALSRGAGWVHLVELNKEAYAQLQKIAHAFHSTKIQVTQGDTLHYIQNTTATFDLIFLDPPFDQPHLFRECLDIFAKTTLLAPGGLLYLEAPHTLSLDDQHWKNIKLKQAGAVIYALYQKSA